MSERTPQPSTELINLRNCLDEAISSFAVHTASAHPLGKSVASCYPCIDFKTVIQGTGELIKKAERKILATNNPNSK
jgi:hypothetical protein